MIVPIKKKELSICENAKTIAYVDYYRHPNGWFDKEEHKKVQKQFIKNGRASDKVRKKSLLPLASK